MSRIVIESGVRREEVFALQGGEEVKIGVAEYDLEDITVISKLAHLKDDLYKISEEYNPKIDGAGDDLIKLADTTIEYFDKMVEKVDDVFGVNFVKNAIGEARNPFMLWAIVAEIIYNYEGVRDDRMSKYTNRKQRRAGNKK